jgi:hypothetical protein
MKILAGELDFQDRGGRLYIAEVIERKGPDEGRDLLKRGR